MGYVQEVQLKKKFGYTEDGCPYVSSWVGLGVRNDQLETCFVPGEQIVKLCFKVLLYELLTRHGTFHSRCVANTLPVSAT